MSAPKPVAPLRLKGKALMDRNSKIDTRDCRRCARCGCAIWSNGSRHHRKFRSRRGGDEVSNGVLLCGSGTTGCHGWVHDNPAAARAEGFAVESHEEPRMVPVQHALFGRVWMADDGSVTTE